MFVIRLSRDPAIPTFYATDERLGIGYGASIEEHAVHYRTYHDASNANIRLRFNGSVQQCQCSRLRDHKT